MPGAARITPALERAPALCHPKKPLKCRGCRVEKMSDKTGLSDLSFPRPHAILSFPSLPRAFAEWPSARAARCAFLPPGLSRRTRERRSNSSRPSLKGRPAIVAHLSPTPPRLDAPPAGRILRGRTGVRARTNARTGCSPDISDLVARASSRSTGAAPPSCDRRAER
jgi:hypothetical protein